ncbi:MAG: tetratricopeptide repeat protein [Gemmatimonadaceae bacterium]
MSSTVSNTRSRIRFVAPIAAVLMGGCFASQQDVRVLQSDISLLRTETATADSARRLQLDRAIASMRTANDSLASLSTKLTRFRSDVTTSLASVDQQLLQVQELTGQSQRRIQEVRASLEERQGAAAAASATAPGAKPAAAGSAGSAGAGAADAGPGPNQLFQVAREQLMQGSNAAARQAFEDLLTKYPKSDLAADAQFYVAETYAAENNVPAADSVYARVAARYAGSPRAATAVYKRAVAAQNAGKIDQARDLFNQLIKKYPRSDEASLARDRVKALK